ncbi:Chloride anion exchanger [Schistosoma japonicum]|nr:Chloride anion exchanger [Schistosoma japonicum]
MSNNHKDTDNILLERKYSITREIYNVDKFLQDHPKSSEKHEKFSQHKILKSCTCSKFANLLSFIFPFYSVLVPFYNLRSFVLDCIAGLTLSIVHIPQGTFSVVSLLTADPVDRLISTLDVNNRSLEKYQVFNENQQIDDFRLQIVVTVCILAGLFQLVLGIVRLDVLVVYISEPLLGGFTCASAIHVFSSQLNGLFGIKLNRATGPFRIFYIMKNFIYIVKETNITTLLISLICIFIVWCFKHYINPKVSTKIHFTIPIELIVLVIGTVFSKFYLLNQRYGVSIVGEIPVGLPSPLLPDVRLVPEVLMESIASLVSCCILLLVITVIGQFLQTVPMAVKLPKIIILKYGGPLYYANAESFQNWINRLTHIDPYKVVKYRQHIKQQQEQYQRRKQRKLNSNSHNRQHHVVRSQPSSVKNLTKHMKPKKKDCEEFSNDLELLVRSYSELNIRILFTVCDPQIQSVLTSGSLTLSQFQHNSFMSIHDAVIYCQGILSTTTTSTNLDTTDHSTEEKELHLPIENLSIDYADSSDPVEDVILDSVTTTKL